MHEMEEIAVRLGGRALSFQADVDIMMLLAIVYRLQKTDAMTYD